MRPPGLATDTGKCLVSVSTHRWNSPYVRRSAHIAHWSDELEECLQANKLTSERADQQQLARSRGALLQPQLHLAKPPARARYTCRIKGNACALDQLPFPLPPPSPCASLPTSAPHSFTRPSPVLFSATTPPSAIHAANDMSDDDVVPLGQMCASPGLSLRNLRAMLTLFPDTSTTTSTCSALVSLSASR